MLSPTADTVTDDPVPLEAASFPHLGSSLMYGHVLYLASMEPSVYAPSGPEPQSVTVHEAVTVTADSVATSASVPTGADGRLQLFRSHAASGEGGGGGGGGLTGVGG